MRQPSASLSPPCGSRRDGTGQLAAERGADGCKARRQRSERSIPGFSQTPAGRTVSATGELRRETAGWEKQIESLGNHRYRATKPAWYRYREDWDTERFGDILVTNNCFPSRATGVCSGRRVRNGFLVKDCDFGHNRSRGILIKASRGQVVGNRISHGWMAAVLVAPEFWWLEAASSSDVEIRDNVIVGCLC